MANGGSMSIIDQITTDQYTIGHGDCVEFLRGLPDASIGYSIFSPPFASLYTYSNSPRDMGNVRNDAEFFEHFEFLIAQLRRVMKPGRNVSFHCMDMPASKERDGYIGLKDFPGDLLRAFQRHGFIFASKATIWKDPVTAMTRTKALGLLHKSVRERSEMCRQGIPDYLITVRARASQSTSRTAPKNSPLTCGSRSHHPFGWTSTHPKRCNT
jgi:hypothetical protein